MVGQSSEGRRVGSRQRRVKIILLTMAGCVTLSVSTIWPAGCGGEAISALAAESSLPSEIDNENIRYFTDLPVVTHRGETVRFYTDLLRNKKVVISFFYVHCPTAQPTLLTLFKLQKKLGERLGSEVVLLSMSVDPQRDSPEAVRAYAEKFNPQDGWYFVTGKPESMDVINKRLGNTMRLPEGHLRQFIVGNTRTNHWLRLVESVPVMALEDGLRSLESKQ